MNARIILTILTLTIATNTSAAESSKYLNAVREFADNVLKYGRDTYGPKNTPLFVDGLNIHTHEPVEWIAPNGDRWILSNLASQQNLFRTLDGLTTITGDPKYRQAATEAIGYAFENLRDPNGLLYWGDTAAYDASGDRLRGNVHSLKLHYPYYELMWMVDPRETKKFIDAFWSGHITDWSNLDMNRLTRYTEVLEEPWSHEYEAGPIFFESKRGFAPIYTATSLIHAATMMYTLSGREQPVVMVWSKRLAKRYVDTRHPNTGISYEGYNQRFHQFGDDLKEHFNDQRTTYFPYYSFDPFMHNVWPQNIQAFPWVSMFLIGQELGKEGKVFTQWALEEFTAWGKASYRKKDNSFVPILTDGTSLEGYVWKEAPGPEPEGLVVKSWPVGMPFFWAYSVAYCTTGDEFIWEMLRNIAIGNGFGDIGETSTCIPELKTDISCSHVYGLLGFLQLYEKTNRPQYLEMARRIGDNILSSQFHKGFFVPSGKHIYSRFDCLEPLALLHLHAAMKSVARSVPGVWPNKPIFSYLYRHRDKFDHHFIYTLTESPEPSLSLQEAVALGDVNLLRTLIEKGTDVDSPVGGSYITALHLATRGRHKSIVELLLAEGASVDARDWNCATPLHYAVERGHKKIAELLIVKGADVNAKDGYGQTPLDTSLSRNRMDIVRLLAEAGADVSIHVAAHCGILAKVKSLIEEGCDINTKDSSGKTPLHYAVEGEQKDVVEFLITNGADINMQPRRRETPLHIAAIRGHREIAELLIANNAVIKKRQSLLGRFLSTGTDTSDIHLAACSGDIARLKHFVEEESDVNVKDRSGWTPLFWAASMGRKEAVELFISSGADIHTKVGGSMTLLHRAAEADKPGIVELLISKGLDVDAAAWGGLTPLHIAARSGNRKVAEILINNGADINSRNSDGQTPLHLSAYKGYKDIAQLLISGGADLSAENRWHQTPLDIAAYYGYREVVELINKHRSDEVESPAVSPADINKKTYTYQMPLHKAAVEADLDAVKSLISKGADINAESNDGWTALHRAAVFGHADIIKFLLANGAKVDTVNRWGWTPLHSASLYGHKDVVALLLSNGADIQAETPAGETALQIATQRGYKEIADLLRKHGTKK
jgi:ankyrin repeat protein